MMENRKEFAARFAEVLNAHLVKKYNKVPSGYFFANQFNLEHRVQLRLQLKQLENGLKVFLCLK